jgi:hypothetical protein
MRKPNKPNKTKANSRQICIRLPDYMEKWLKAKAGPMKLVTYIKRHFDFEIMKEQEDEGLRKIKKSFPANRK